MAGRVARPGGWNAELAWARSGLYLDALGSALLLLMRPRDYGALHYGVGRLAGGTLLSFLEQTGTDRDVDRALWGALSPSSTVAAAVESSSGAQGVQAWRGYRHRKHLGVQHKRMRMVRYAQHHHGVTGPFPVLPCLGAPSALRCQTGGVFAGSRCRSPHHTVAPAHLSLPRNGVRQQL